MSELRHYYTEEDYYRVYYRDNNNRLLCYHQHKDDGFILYECEPSGEPSHSIPFEKYLLITEIPVGDDSEMESRFIKWLENQLKSLITEKVSDCIERCGERMSIKDLLIN